MKPVIFLAASSAMAWAAFAQSPISATNSRSSLSHFRSGEIYFSQKNLQDAANEFRDALDGNRDVSWTLVWSHINLGKIFDITGQCDRAVNEYRLAVATGDNTFRAQDEANAYLHSNTISEFSFQPQTLSDLPHAAIVNSRVLLKTVADYAPEARLAGLEGTVLVHGVIAADGSAQDLHVTAPLGLGLDEKAIDTVRNWTYLPASLDDQAVASTINMDVEFRLPDKTSRWHLIRVQFRPGAGDSRPSFARADYPSGSGVRRDAIDDARLVAVVGRYATTTLSFDVNEQGVPVNFVVVGASRPVWGQEAINVVRKWRFHPGLHDGIPVAVPCQVDLVWGARILASHPQFELNDIGQPQHQPVEVCRTPR